MVYENEMHFVTSCETYDDLRFKFFQQVLQATDGEINLHNEKDKTQIFELILCATRGAGDVFEKVCNAALTFVFLAMQRRAALVGERLA